MKGNRIDWCAWCNITMRGKVSKYYGLCSACRRTSDGRAGVKIDDDRSKLSKD